MRNQVGIDHIYKQYGKRAFDVIGSIGGLVAATMPMVAIAIAIRVFYGRPVLFRQERIGRDGKAFLLYKFRTMTSEGDMGLSITVKGDSRITTIGRILRTSKLDELPQLVNILKGDMSFVGPRPERPGFVNNFLQTLPGYSERHKVKPGITGLAQVRGYYDTAAENKLKYDLAYIYNQSFSLDLMILLETIKTVLIKPGS